MNWYDFDYQASVELDQTLDLYTRQHNLIETFRMFKIKVEEVEATANSLNMNLQCENSAMTTKIHLIEEENRILKHLVKKMALKDYPELVFENPHFFEDKN